MPGNERGLERCYSFAHRSLAVPHRQHPVRRCEQQQDVGTSGERPRQPSTMAVLPLNPSDVVDRVLTRFGLTYDSSMVISIDAGGQTFLPVDTPRSSP